uniref:hypothetical protein n=1 Tax=Enterocloster aldenensis TaxID=358742 RepID=UPI0011C3A1D6
MLIPAGNIRLRRGRGCGVLLFFLSAKDTFGEGFSARCSGIFANFLLFLIVPAVGEMPKAGQISSVQSLLPKKDEKCQRK